MKKFAHSVKLTNDVAERGVKLVSDYSDILTTDSDERKRLVLAVQNHRRMYKAMKKSDLMKRIDVNQNVEDGGNASEDDPEPLDDFDEWSDDGEIDLLSIWLIFILISTKVIFSCVYYSSFIIVTSYSGI